VVLEKIVMHLTLEAFAADGIRNGLGTRPRNKGPFAHLELDIHADKDNKQGFNPGGWIPRCCS
jgi:uncharacterized protein involved in high-affinity Fe2+ transport